MFTYEEKLVQLSVWGAAASQNIHNPLLTVGVFGSSDGSFISTLNCIYWELAPTSDPV